MLTKSWNTLAVDRAERLARGQPFCLPRSKVCPLEQLGDLLHAVIESGDRVPTGLRGGDQPVRTRPGLVPRALL